MNKTLLSILSAILLFSACSKGGSNPSKSTLTNKLVGTRYKLYKAIDTNYNYQPNNGVFYDITYDTMFGDTLHLNVGSSTVIIQPSPQPGYDPNFALADTLIFKTTTSGIDSEFPGADNNITPFTYSLTNHTLTEGPDDISQIIIINDNTLETVSTEINNGKKTFSGGGFYRKL